MPDEQDVSIRRDSAEKILQGSKLRSLSRSPHPYHHQRSELPHATLRPRATFQTGPSPLRSRQYTDDEWSGEGIRSARGTESDSGTEADDEHFLKGLPAPRWRPHKGLRGGDRTFSGSPSPLASPEILNEVPDKLSDYLKGPASATHVHEADIRKTNEKFQRKRMTEFVRRLIEISLLNVLGAIVMSSHYMVLEVSDRRRETSCLILIIALLIVLYPLRLIMHSSYGRASVQGLSFAIPTSIDPAPFLYPPTLTMFVASILSVSNHAVYLPNVILSISSLPSELIPTMFDFESSHTLHWFLSCIPLFVSEENQALNLYKPSYTEDLVHDLGREVLVLLYPLHWALCATLQYMTTTSLLRAELQLLSIALINLLLLSSSPQAVILKALLWGGGLGILITCNHVLRWGVALARVPRWRFRRESMRDHRLVLSSSKIGQKINLLRKWKAFLNIRKEPSRDSSDDDGSFDIKPPLKSFDLKLDSHNLKNLTSRHENDGGSMSAIEKRPDDNLCPGNADSIQGFAITKAKQRRHTLSYIGQSIVRLNTKTPSGRRKRSASSSLQCFFSLTERQASIRKWMYAGYVYICVLLIILLGIRPYVGKRALHGNESIGWALGYIFGNLPWFRMKVVVANLERWVCLPGLGPLEGIKSCNSGWVEHTRHATFGPANIRLILCAYWLTIIIVGLAIVFRLSAICEVDTRRKVFHFMMVGMLLPTTYIDPAFAALALSLVLVIFLILDLLRASQLPPLSKPLAYFLAPYVDGRDLRGPVVISHIFLLIGSAIPLWLSLGALPRGGTEPWDGWEVPIRDVSMVSGVICVGMGDAAASLIGRRYGRHKWFWSGGKTIEGSVAFAAAVSMALLLARAWLRIGGWPSDHDDTWTLILGKISVAASLASLTEAVLTGGNDNVIVPVVLWLCVKGLGI